MQTKPKLVYDDALISEIAVEIANPANAEDTGKWTGQLAEIYEQPDPTVCYQSRDWKIVDYHSTRIAKLDYAVRGPVPEVLNPGEYFVTLGSAATFGAGVQRPYAALLSQELGMPALNLGFAGASPEFYVGHHAEGLRHWLAGAAFVIVEVMSSRSVSNSRFQTTEGRSDAIDLKKPDKPPVNSMITFRKLHAGDKKHVLARLIGESLEAHEALFDDLVAMSPAPVVGLWLSTRSPDTVDRDQLREDIDMRARALTVHPQFADRKLVDQLAQKCREFVEVTSQRGQPVTAVNRFTGEPENWWNGTPTQSYYPSQEMHEDAAMALLPVVRGLAGTGG